jgi:hypothetical protein
MTSIAREALETPSTWLGPELLMSEDWVRRLTPAEIVDLENGLAAAKASGKAMTELTRDDFPLPILAPSIASWMESLQSGRGFINVKGIPIEGRDVDDIALFHWGLGLHMGTAVSQNAAGDVLGHLRDTGANPDDTSVRLYKTRVDPGFHSDGSDLVALLCVRQGQSGGENRLVSTAALYNEIQRRRSDLIPLLYEPFFGDRNDEQSDGQDPFFQLPICRYAKGKLTFFSIPWHIRKAQRHSQVPRFTPEQTELLDLIDEIAEDPAFHVEMRLEPGEINYLKNNAVLHTRSEYKDFDDPERKRHLVRLWLTVHQEWADGDAFVQKGIPVKKGVTSDADDIAEPAKMNMADPLTIRSNSRPDNASTTSKKEESKHASPTCAERKEPRRGHRFLLEALQCRCQ